MHDVDFNNTIDWCDVKAFLNDGERCTRAAYAITHCIIDHETA